MNKRAGELSDDEVERVVTIMQNPRQYKIPDWFLNRQKDNKDGKYSQVDNKKAYTSSTYHYFHNCALNNQSSLCEFEETVPSIKHVKTVCE